MLKFNNLIWTIFFKTVKPLTDNAGIVIILFSIFLESDSLLLLIYIEKRMFGTWDCLMAYILPLYFIC